jgi:site-specific DNA-adenine methylase
MKLLFYPGSKNLKSKKILAHLLPLLRGVEQYREPFAGSGVIGLSVMSRCPQLSYWLNDRDAGLACVWYAARHHGSELVKLVETFTPSVDAFRDFKAELDGLVRPPDQPQEIVEIGFRKLALHQMSHSGFGKGVRGGLRQDTLEKITARWSPEVLAKKLLIIHNRLRRCRAQITGFDFSRLIEDTSRRSCLYLDPPYLGNRFSYYEYEFAPADHHRLAGMLGESPHRFALSHAAIPEIRKLYDWAEIVEIDEQELLIIGK